MKAATVLLAVLVIAQAAVFINAQTWGVIENNSRRLVE
jgi:hypothetical protein